MVAALERGVPVRVVLYGKYGASTIEAMKALRDRGLDLDFRVFKSRVMHEKFGVSGDGDLFNGSANWSTSSMLKHSEDRFVFHNEPERPSALWKSLSASGSRVANSLSQAWEWGEAFALSER